LRADGNSTPVLLLTTFDDPDLTLRAAACGSQGFLLKDASPEDLQEAIMALAHGKILLAPVPTDSVRSRYAYHETSAPADSFNELESPSCAFWPEAIPIAKSPRRCSCRREP
jgi:DNA-binding NarL/FixJ family response regulator